MPPAALTPPAHALLAFASGFTAEIAVAVARNMDNRAIITGTKGKIVMDDPWVPGRNAGPSDAWLHITSGDDTRTEAIRDEAYAFRL